MRVPLLALLSLFLLAPFAPAQVPEFQRTEDVVYGRKFGTALTLDVIRPTKNANGLGLVWVISGGWFSSHDHISPPGAQEFLRRGYTIFAVVHGSNPRYTIPEVVQDMNRAVRFIRANAKKYDVDPDRLGIFGGSAGGHLSLMIGTAGTAGDPNSKDPIDQVSSRVQAVACFFPPTDFLNYGKPGEIALGCGVLAGFKAPFAFSEIDKKTGTFVPITEVDRILAIGKQISPAYHVSADDPPTLIIHGDADKLVPIQQAELVIDKLKALKVPCELVVRAGQGHGWKGIDKDLAIFADWFDKHLGKAGGAKGAAGQAERRIERAELRLVAEPAPRRPD